MNLEKLKQAESVFLRRYPGGFAHPDMLAMGKKHKVEQLVEFARAHFGKNAFRRSPDLLDSLQKLVSRSSMVSVFEKTRFRNMLKSTPPHELDPLVMALRERLHGNSEKGFDRLVKVLDKHALAKWPLVSVVPAYFRPHDEVFIKPTTVKGVVNCFELEAPDYVSRPDWRFYASYRDHIQSMKQAVDPVLAPSNAAFSGFLMMTMDKV